MAAQRKYELSKKDVIEKWAKNYPKVMTWLGKIQRKNHNAWFLWLYCKSVGKNPNELLALKEDSQSKQAEYLLDQLISEEKLGLTNAIKVNVAIAVKSFYKHNYIDLAKASGQITFIKQKPYRRHTKEELLKIYRSAQNPRDRTLIPFVWSTAIAKETLSKIQWLHLEPDWEKQELPHISLPDVLIKGHGIGKYAGVRQETFLTPEAKRDLIEYRDWLERIKGVKFSPEDNIFVQVEKPFKPITIDILSNINTRLAEYSGIPFSWHDARRYVETAVEETRIHPNWARKIRGRKIRGEESPYSRPAIEQLRAAYKEAVPLLEFTQPTQLIQIQRRQEIVEQLTSKMMNGEALTAEDKENIGRYGIKLTLKRTFKTPFIHPKRRRRHRTAHNGGSVDCGEHFEQIKETDILSYLQQGWTIIHRLQSGEVIVKR